METNSAEDLSEGKIPEDEKKRFGGELDEERQRRRWKTGLLRAGAVVTAVFYLTLLCFLSKLDLHDIKHGHALIAGILAAVPSLIAFQMFKIVSRPIRRESSDDDSVSAWQALFKDFIEAFKAGRS